MTYTHLPPPGGGPWRIGAHQLHWNRDRFELDEQSGRLLGPAGVANKDAVVFTLADGRVALIHRIHPDMQLAVFDDLDHLWDAPEDYWDAHLADLERHTLLRPSPGALGIGAGAPPVRTPEGLLLFFHERRANGSYTMNVALLDELTGRVVSRLPEPVLEPELDWSASVTSTRLFSSRAPILWARRFTSPMAPPTGASARHWRRCLICSTRSPPLARRPV